jgi:phage FluMu protein gp41
VFTVVEGEGVDDSFPEGERSWHDEALRAVSLVALTANEFTTDDVWDALVQAGKLMPTDRRAMGGVMSSAALLGYCAPTDRIHRLPGGGRARVWRSLLID